MLCESAEKTNSATDEHGCNPCYGSASALRPGIAASRSRREERAGGTEDLVQEAVAWLPGHNEWFQQQVQIGVDQIACGEFIEGQEMDDLAERMLRS